MYRITFLFFVIFSGFSVKAQEKKYLIYQFKWPEVENIPLKEQFADQDAVILQEETEVNFRSQEVSKHVRIKLLTAVGVERHATVRIPDSFDPPADYYNVNFLKNPGIHRPKLDDNDLIYFVARVIRKDGTVEKAQLTEKQQQEFFLIKGTDRKYYAYFFTIGNVGPGDEIDCYYSYSFPLDFFYRNSYLGFTNDLKLQERDLKDQLNATYSRIFFHGDLPKQRFQLDFVCRSNSLFIFRFPNEGMFTDSVCNQAKNFTKMTWKKENLQPCLNERGSRIYTELPYVHFYVHNKDFGLKNDPNDLNFTSFLPYPWAYAIINHIGYKTEPHVFERKDKVSLALRDIYRELTDSLPDTTLYGKLFGIHNSLNKDFDYLDDYRITTGEDNRLERLDVFLKQKTLRQRSRFRLYYYLIDRLNAEYFTSNLHDKRVEEIEFDRFFPELSFNKFISVKDNNKIFYLRPKKHRFGMNLNELPFYLENTRAIHVPQTLDREDFYKNTYDLSYLQTFTPSSSEKDNIRNSFVRVHVNTDSLTLGFEAKVELSGQFSTMMRGFYQYGYIDSTVNGRYHRRICDIPESRIEQCSLVSSSQKFPFKSNFRVKYSSPLPVGSGKEFGISLRGWFSHIILEQFSAKNRQLSFYPDFRHQDLYIYQLKFDKPVKVVNESDFAFDIFNAFGRYKVKISQPSPDIVQLESLFVVSSEAVPASEVKGVEQIYSAIGKLEDSSLKVIY